MSFHGKPSFYFLVSSWLLKNCPTDTVLSRSIRLSLLNSCTTFDAEQVGFDFFQSLPELWTLSNDKTGSMNPIDAIEREASKPEFWRMGSSFLKKYPCFETFDDV